MQTDAISALETLIHNAPEHIHLWRFIEGAVFALQSYDDLAVRSSKSEQTDEFYRNEAVEMLMNLRSNTPPPPNWLRGFFYNAAVMRLDAAWERSMRIILAEPNDGDGPGLYERLRHTKAGMAAYDDSRFSRVRKEVNALKHQGQGARDAIREQPEVLRGCLQDLLVLLERNFPKPATTLTQ